MQILKYLEMNINSKVSLINESIASGINCYYGINKLLNSKLLTIKSKTLLYTRYLRPRITIITFSVKHSLQQQKNNNRLTIFERKVLRNIFGSL